MSSTHCLVHDKGGASAIELAMLAPAFLLLIYGGIELARYYYLENRIQAAASASIRHATATRAIDEEALRDLFFSELDVYDTSVITDLDFLRSNHSLASVERLEVVIDYQFRPVTSLILPDNLDREFIVKGLVPVSN